MKIYKLITNMGSITENELSGYDFKGSFKQAKIKVLEYAIKKFNFYNAMGSMENVEVYYWITCNDNTVLTGFINKNNVK